MKLTLNDCWQDALKASLRRLRRPDTTRRIAVVGVGSELRGDDAAGLLVARALGSLLTGHDNVLILEGGSAPENVTGALRRFHPHLVLLADAAQFNAPPGAVRWLDWRAAAGFGASTHTGSLSIVGDYLSAQLGCEVALLGIQMGGDALGAPLTSEVMLAVEELAYELHSLITGIS